MKAQSSAKRAQLDAANAFVLELLGKGLGPHEVIDEMIERIGADCRYRSGTHQLICAGVTGTSKCNTSEALLASWRKKTMLRLCEPVGGYDRND